MLDLGGEFDGPAVAVEEGAAAPAAEVRALPRLTIDLPACRRRLPVREIERYLAVHVAGGLVVEPAAAVAENDYLKSAGGAGRTLNRYRGQ
ncbi:hypothetical protein [Streptomyces qinzhouensis]|uniref:Uncharacterized protein n=1 Tax=Streptomyces qinzhouensis TaxID=2599401 RepID=A0A5B8JID3_9ACTN|nr:hypothetical protein [Streptomyces qinzhouensis]QDY80134.1 hypothetical protein FQU76_30585 [Streptomyces qinzhouensis]